MFKYLLLSTFLAFSLNASMLSKVPLNSSRWDYDPELWKNVDSRLLGTSKYDSEWALYKSPSHYSKVSFEVEITPGKGRENGWSSGSIGIFSDRNNYWLLSFQQSPASNGARRLVDLNEMQGGQWLSEKKLRILKHFSGNNNFVWKPGTKYIMRLELTDRFIKGTVMNQDEEILWQLVYELKAGSVKTGVPALYLNFMSAPYKSAKLALSSSKSVPPPSAEKHPKYVSPDNRIKSRKGGTGFFRVEKNGNRWWMVAPDGKYFWAIGTDHVNYTKHFCEKLGYAPYRQSVDRIYETPEKWASATVERLKKWGFNSLGTGSSQEVRYKGLPHLESLAVGTLFAATSPLVSRGHWTGFPNVFDPEWKKFCESQARKQCLEHINDPWLIGYFLDNELEWFGRTAGGSENGLFIEVMKQAENHSAKQALINFLKERYDNKISSFNKAWQLQYANWQELACSRQLPAVNHEAQLAQEKFLELIGEKYFGIISKAIRKADPNHMLLGSRFAGNAPEWAWRAAGKYCDVISFNMYPWIDLDTGNTDELRQRISHFYKLSKRPMMITEWSFLGLDAGLPCKHGGGMRVDTQEQRTKACEYMQKMIFNLPFMVGSNYFMWADEPELGISSTFPEDGSYGLVNKDDKPYKKLVDMFSVLNKKVYDLHAQSNTNINYASFDKNNRSLPVKNGRVKYQQKGKAFKINNGVLSIEYDGLSGNFADRIKLKGHLLGHYNPMVRQYSDHSYWLATDRVEKVSFSREGKNLIVDLIASGGGEEESVSFKVAHRWRIFPGSPWFEASIIWVQNGSKKRILRVKSLFISLYSCLSGDQKDDMVDGKNLKYYYKNGRMACWIDSKNKLRFGITAAKYGRYDYIDGQGLLKIQYYTDHKGQHPDCRIILDPLLELLPGKRFYLKPQRKFLIFGAEKDEWNEIKNVLEKWSSN